MPKNYSLFFLFVSQFFLAQFRFTVVDSESRDALKEVKIFCGKEPIGFTDRQGTFANSKNCDEITLELAGYENITFRPKGVTMVQLKRIRDKSEIQEVLIKDESDPKALRILVEYLRRFDQNSPKSLAAYRFSGYSKIAIDVAQDSLPQFSKYAVRRRDSLASRQNFKANAQPTFKSRAEAKEATQEIDFLSTQLQSGIFLWEKIQEFRYSQKLGEKVVIQDSRTSGLKKPIYEFVAVNLSNLNRVPRQLQESNRYRYRFFLADSAAVDGRETYVINFRELESKDKARRRKFLGKIYIDKGTFGLKMIESSSKKAGEGEVKSVWAHQSGKWFLQSEDIRARVGKQVFPMDSVPGKKREKIKFGNYLRVKNRFFDFDGNPSFKEQDFSGYTYSIEKSDGSLLSTQRPDSLSAREQNTYASVDSLADKLGIERKLGLLTSGLRGRLRVGKVDILPGRLFDYNKYEGIRLGLGLKTNEGFSRRFSPDGYFGYGFQDHQWKFGLGLDARLSQERNSILRAEYQQDVAPFGKFSRDLWPGDLLLRDLISYSRNGNFYHLKGGSLSWETDLTNALTLKVAGRSYHEFADTGYAYRNAPADYRNFSLKASLLWAPNDRNIMTPQGKYAVESGYPKVFLTLEKGLKILGGDLDYLRLEALIFHRFKSRAGATAIQVYGGFSSGQVPIWKNFEIAGTTAPGLNFGQRISLESNLLFYTMPSAEFYATSFGATHLAHTLPFRFKLGKVPSQITVNYAAAVGRFKNPEEHRLDFMTPDKFYQELGLTWNHFLGTMLDVSAYYRFGAYHQPKFSENVGFSLGFGF